MVASLVLHLEAFTKLSAEERSALGKISNITREIAPRRDVVREGENPRHVHLMVQGWACRYKTLPDGRRQILSFMIPGDFCDLDAYVLKQMDHSIGSVTRVRVADVTRDEMDGLTQRYPRIAQALRWHELVNVSVQREWTLNIGQRSACERIAHLLVELFLRLRSIGLTNGDRCDFPLTQTDVAEATGLTAVHVNRTLQDLRRKALFEFDRRQLRIPDLQRLMEVSMFNPNYLHLDHEGRHLDATA